jgi:transposase InsO family protein
VLEHSAIMISMDGKGRCMDNIFVERLWRSLKYEEVYLNGYGSEAEAKAGIAACEVDPGFGTRDIDGRAAALSCSRRIG